MKIYDCFTFFNELDLLELRLKQLDSVVDYFVIVEANKTFSGAPKPSIFLQNEKRFERWKSKILYLYTDLPSFNLIDKIITFLMDSKFLPRFGTSSLGLNYLANLFGIGRWKFVFSQRDKIGNLLRKANEEDIILFSDLDEIPRIKSKKQLQSLVKEDELTIFKQKHFIYYINGLTNIEWLGTRALLFKTFLKKFKGKFSLIRDKGVKERVLGLKRKVKYIEDGGWHFTYLGGVQKVYTKCNSVAEASSIKKTKDSLKEDIESGVFRNKKNDFVKIDYVKLDSSFPEAITKNLKRYSRLIK